MEKQKSTKTSLGLNENIEGLLCYALGWLTGVVFLVLEKESKFVKFHAMQSLVTFLALLIAVVVLGWIPFIGQLISVLISLLGLVLWLLLMYKAYKGEKYKVPIVGDFAEKQAEK